MGKIFCLMGKSSSGKDTVYKKLLENPRLSLHTIIPCTTRPIRDGETHGVEYYFYTKEALRELEQQGKIIELRSYDTIHGIWKYFTADDNQIHLEQHNYLIIGTLASYEKMRAYFGFENLVPLYLYLDDGLRLQRALEREQLQKEPKYAEMCRRFLADELDFSIEKLNSAGIKETFKLENNHLQETVDKLAEIILQQIE